MAWRIDAFYAMISSMLAGRTPTAVGSSRFWGVSLVGYVKVVVKIFSMENLVLMLQGLRVFGEVETA